MLIIRQLVPIKIAGLCPQMERSNQFFSPLHFVGPMDTTEQEKKQKRLVELRKVLEKEIDEKRRVLDALVEENKHLENEQRLLEVWLEKYTDEELAKL